jgi:predicted double-glycine peptidase
MILLLLANVHGEASVAVLNATPLLSGVPDVRQGTEYSCGAAALQAVLSYWGRDIGEEDLIELLNTDPESGTYPEDIIRVAREMGLEAEMKENLTLEEINASVNGGIPMIVDCQAWKSPAAGNLTWENDWDDGHWMVILGMDGKNVYFEDPYILGSRGFMSRQEFEERWHNPRGWSESDTVKQIHLGIFVRGERPATPRLFRHVD